jgi:DNA-binding beta-propeller fold protein YncE
MKRVSQAGIRVVVLVLFVFAVTAATLLSDCGVGRAFAQGKAASGKNPFPRRFDVPEFPKDLDWLNSGPLTKQDLKGKFVLLDFWTFCCINCMHILPELKKLEEKYPNELVVIGVHSAKFEGEKDTDNIRDAILRYEIAHPVVNDSEHQIWDMFGVSSWPTILMIDPEGKAVWGRPGEFKASEVDTILKNAIPYYRRQGLLNEKPVKFELESHKTKSTPLRFPGKVLADEKSNRLFIADSNHNRYVVTTLDGELLDTIGSGAVGKNDGDFATATFNHPQGMALRGDTLYVADTENHMLRKIDLKKRTVATISGDGEQADSPPRGGKPAKTQLNSPWDLWIHENDLYIAMAGPHQIWKMHLDESAIFPYAGNGREDIVDGPLMPRKPFELGFASFAQPSGLTSDGTWLYVADSEGSSIRAVPFISTKEVKTVVGTSELPAGRLFYFGDVDGPRERVKLQHCLGVAYDAGKIYVADTYNNKIKVVDAETGATKTLVGTGEAGGDDQAPTFDEPAGLSLAGRKLYVADTNNHAIRIVDLETNRVSTLDIAGLTPPMKKKDTKPDFSGAAQVELEPTTVKAVDGKVKLEVSLELPPGWKINPLGRPSYWFDSPKESGVVDRAAFSRHRLDEPSTAWTIELPVQENGKDTVQVLTNYYYCQKADEGVCKIGAVVFTIPLTVSGDAKTNTIQLRHEVKE